MDYIRYLRSKQTVDDRALNLRVLQEFEACLAKHTTTSNSSRLRIVEVGGGIGSMFMRLLRRNKSFENHKRIEYTIVDINHDVLLAAQESILREAPAVLDMEPVLPPDFNALDAKYGFVDRNIASQNGAHRAGKNGTDSTELCRIALTEKITIRLVLGDAITYLARKKKCFDVVIGAAVLDLWDLDSTLKICLAALDNSKGPAAFYFPITFDGTTDFFPESSEGGKFDSQIEAEYHRVMGSRKILGCDSSASHTGRRLVPCLKKLGASLKSMGGSTWIVSANSNHQYEADEAFFLDSILGFIESSSSHFEGKLVAQDPKAFARWLQSRRKQIADGSLVYQAHNIDVFGVL